MNDDVRRSAASPIPWILGAWALLAALPTTSAFLASSGRSFEHWLAYFAPIGLYYGLWALLTPVVYRLVVRLPTHRQALPLTLLAHAALFLGFTALAVFPVHGPHWREWLYGSNAAGHHAMGAFTYALLVLGCFVYHYHREGLERERETAEARLRAARLEGQLSLARIDALRGQINPHFLFNALNSIAALIETERNDEAYRTTELLGALLRTALDSSRHDRVPLGEELDFVERYVELERIRFGERLRFETQVEPCVRDVPVPAFVLQPIVENAVKHAVATAERAVTVRLLARRVGERVEIEISDDGPGFERDTPARVEARHGLGNVAERLRLVYGETARFVLDTRPGGGAQVRLELPTLPAAVPG